MSVKENQKTLKEDIEEYIQEESLRKTMKTYKDKTGSKRPMSQLMLDCLLESENILTFLTDT